jgi:hypothetical protein
MGADDVSPLTTHAFDLPDRLAHKADPTLVAADEAHFAAIAESLERTVADLTDRLAAARRARAGHGQAALERDQEVHRLSARLRTLRRFGLDLCLGHMVPADDPGQPVYVGRLGLTDASGRRLLVDWRSPAAEPFFAATHANPMGLESRRRYRWTRGRVSDYWDEVFTPETFASHVSLDDQSSFVASLGAERSERMRDVLGTIQADQDAIIRAGSRGALVVDGGPGTGKTVVALHRTAYLLYSDPRLGHRRGGVLFVGPHEPYLAYVSDVLPSLGEEGVRTCTLRDLLPEGAAALPEADAEVARLKASADWVGAVDRAVRFYEETPTVGVEVSTPWADLWLSAADWATAVEAVEPGTPHNEARDQVLDEVAEILVATYEADHEEPGDEPGDEARVGEGTHGGHGDTRDVRASREQLRRAVLRDAGLLEALGKAWPTIDASDLVGDLWSVPAYLHLAAPWLSREEIRALQRPDAQAWTVSDLPILDLARARLGDAAVSGRRRRREAALAAEREERTKVVEHLIESDDSEMHVMSMLRGDDLVGALDDEAALPRIEPDRLAGPFAHVVVDEAQELTDAEWQMLLARCPSRSLTVVGDRAQARHGFTESWQERLARIGLDRVRLASLTVNYRTPSEVMAAAEPVIRAALPDANVPTSIRESGRPVVHGSRADLEAVVSEWLAAHAEGVACVIGDASFTERPRVRSLAPELAKGLEFDLVVLVDPERLGTGIEGAVDRYVAMTRATQQLVVLQG